MTELESFQHELLKKLGYNVVPFYDDLNNICSKYVYFEEDKIVFLDCNAKEVHREHDKIAGDILLRYNEKGCYYCPSLSEKGEPVFYHPGNRKDNWNYLILWENDEYTELDYLNDFELSPDDFFEFIKAEDYVAIKYHKAEMSEQERLEEQPLLDTIISRKNDIEHIRTFIYFVNNKTAIYDDLIRSKIIVYDGDQVIVYGQNFKLLYKKETWWFKIWECKQKPYILFLSDASVYDLLENEKIELYWNNNYSWYSAKTVKNMFVLYSEDTQNTIGHVFDSDFKFIREFNIIGEISEIKEIGDTVIMKVISSTNEEDDTEKYYNLRGSNIVYHDTTTNENFSLPDIYCRNMGLVDPDLYIIRSKVSPSDFIDFESSTSIQRLIEKCGVYCKEKGDKYRKIIECKYDYIRPIRLDEGTYVNLYYIGIVGRDENKKFDLYIDHEMVLQEIPYDKGNSLRILGKNKFISTKDLAGHSIIIRHGKIIFTTFYNIVDIHIEKEYNEVKIPFDFHIGDREQHTVDAPPPTLEDKTKYLIVVSDNDLYGIYSSSGKLLLPIEYSIVEIDEYLTIVLGKKIEDNIDIAEYEESVRFSEFGELLMEVGHYSPLEDVITHEMAIVENNVVYLDNDMNYVWDWEFKHLSWEREDNSNYSYKDSIYDGLGGEMEAIWNID